MPVSPNMIIVGGLPKPEYKVVKYLRKRFSLDSDREALSVALAVTMDILKFQSRDGDSIGLQLVMDMINVLRSTLEKDRHHTDEHGEEI